MDIVRLATTSPLCILNANTTQLFPPFWSEMFVCARAKKEKKRKSPSRLLHHPILMALVVVIVTTFWGL